MRLAEAEQHALCVGGWRAAITPPPATLRPNLRLGDVPGVVQEAIAGGIARLLVLDPGVKRLALVGPLLAAVVAADHAPVARALGAGRNRQRRPVLRAGAVADRLARHGVLLEGVEGHEIGRASGGERVC